MKSGLREKIYAGVINSPCFVRKRAADVVYSLAKREYDRTRTPRIINLFITNRCNLRCSHCFYSAHLNKLVKETSLENYEKIFSSMKDKIHSVVITGGEPFLRGDIVEIIEALGKNCVEKVNIPTNGFLTKVIIEKSREILEKTGVDLNIQVSIDGPERVHDKIRGVRGSYKNAIETIGLLKGMREKGSGRFEITISTTISRTNIDFVDELAGEIGGLGVFHGIQFVRSAGLQAFNINKEILSDFNPGDKVLTIEEMEGLGKKIGEMNKDVNPLLNRTIRLVNDYFIRVVKEKKRFMNCTAGKIDCVIYSDGGVAVCEFTKPFANLKEFNYDFRRLWDSEAANLRRGQTSSCVCTHQCNLMNSLRYDKSSIRKLFDAE